MSQGLINHLFNKVEMHDSSRIYIVLCEKILDIFMAINNVEQQFLVALHYFIFFKKIDFSADFLDEPIDHILLTEFSSKPKNLL